jgi:hypothetical protein
MLRNLEKHQKYKNAYKANDYYWGLGVEHETYLETSKLKQISVKELKENRAAERYSVNYYSIYTTELLDSAIDGLFDLDQKILIPILVNSHTFQKTDLNGEHQTTYERIPKANPKFLGKTIFEWMKEQNPDVFLEDYEKSYIFDGDTVEFMTQNFYKTKVQNVIDELTTVQKEFLRALNSLPREGILRTYGPLQIAQKNYPFASYLTNIKNNAMFNNGTIHINVTLPTKLNENAEIADFELFRKQHQNYARVLQWISPLLVAKYGAYDPLSESKNNGEKYAAGSQRVAVSRYIGLGTFDTDKMPIGKILTEKRDNLNDLDWYESFHKKVDYNFLDNLGMDINFNKHFCHGIEFRILESLPISDLQDILNLFVYLADFSLNTEIINPKKSKLWHHIAENCVLNGKGYLIDVSDQNDLFKLFNIQYLSKEPLTATDLIEIITQHLYIKYKNGVCVQCMINGEDYLKPSIRLSPIPEVPSNNSELDSLSSLEKQQSDINSIIVPITITNSLPPPPPPPSPIKSDTQENEFRPPETAIVVNKKKSWWCC